MSSLFCQRFWPWKYAVRLTGAGKVGMMILPLDESRNMKTAPPSSRGGEKGETVMMLTTTERISGLETETLGLVQGSTIQSKNIGKDITQGFKTLVGGELRAYTEMMNEARALATQRMVKQAEDLGADAVVCVRYASASIMQGAAEVMAYGTAVKFL